MTSELSPKQKLTLEYLRESMDESGRPPTLKEIAGHFGVFISTVQDHIEALQAKGYIRRDKGRARGLALTAKGGLAPSLSLPLLGAVRAGDPREAVENAQERFTLDRSLAGKADYILRVQGDSMEPDILEGDFVAVKWTTEAENGDIVVARVGDSDATVKRLRRKGRAVQLEAANPRYAPITKDFRVIGRVTGLVRSFGR